MFASYQPSPFDTKQVLLAKIAYWLSTIDGQGFNQTLSDRVTDDGSTRVTDDGGTRVVPQP